MPLDMASFVLGKIWRAVAPFNKRHKRALENLAMAFPDKSADEREAIARDMWENLGRVSAETVQIDRLIGDPDRVVSPTNDLLDSLFGHGSVVISLHTGNWELCVWPVTRRGHKPAGIYQKIKNPYVDVYVRQLRAALYTGGLYPKSPDVVRKIISDVRKGGQLAILADQRDNNGIMVPFFGADAPSTPLPAMVAVRLDVPLVIGRVIRLNGSRFRVEAHLLDVARTGDRKADTLETTRRIHATFEDWIREYPSQWMWGHRRWKSR